MVKNVVTPREGTVKHHRLSEQRNRASAAPILDRPVRPLRILTQSASLDPVGGIEMCTLQDSLALARRGHSIDVLYGSDGSMRSDYAAAGIGLDGPYPFGLDLKRAPADMVGFLPAARRVRRLRPDIMWLNRPEHIFWGQTVSRWAGVPLMCHLHHRPNFRLQALYTGVSHFMAVSEYIKGEWVDYGLPAERISVLHNAIAAGDYPFGGVGEQRAARAELGLPVDVSVVLYYGRMLVEKGLLTLLQAWRESGLTSDHAILVMVGSPSPEADPDIARELAHLPAAAYRWLPTQSNIIPFLHAADLVVCPFTAPEPFGRVVIEAMATGRPVIASEVGAVSEILSGKMSRFLVPSRSPSALAARMLSLLHWRRDTPALGAECRAWVERRFPYPAHVEALEATLDTHRRRRRTTSSVPVPATA